MNREQFRQKAIQHICAMDTYDSIMIEKMLNPSKTCAGIQDLIYTYEEPQRTEQELLRENIDKEWDW